MGNFLIFVVIALLSVNAFAQDAEIVWMGGISAEEREQAPSGDTKFVFFVSTGSFLSGLNVEITGANGEPVLETETTGPWMIVNLAPGVYTIRATRGNGDAQSVQFEIDGDGEQEIGIMFPGS